MRTSIFKARHLVGALGLLAAVTVGHATAAATAAPHIVSRDYQIEGQAAGLKLFVRNKHARGAKTFSPERTVLFVHGASLPSDTVFDLPVGKRSWADTLAQNGYDVWLVNVRGYGKSGVPDAVTQAGDGGGPFATTQDAVNDVASAVDFIRAQHKVDKVNLIGWSWGTVITSTYTTAHADRVQSLTLLAPVWPSAAPTTPATTDKPALGPWTTWTIEDARNKLQKGVPPEERDRILPLATRVAWEQAVLRSQPGAAKTSPPRFRSPSGVVADGAAYWSAGKAIYSPEKITVPTFIVSGQWDGLTPPAGAESLYLSLKNAPLKSLLELPRASHFFALETGRAVLIPAVQSFIERASTSVEPAL